MLLSNGIGQIPCKLLVGSLLSSHCFLPQHLHGFCHTVYRIACAANALVIQCLAGGGEGLVLGAGQPGVCHIVL